MNKYKVGELVLITKGSIVDEVQEITEYNNEVIYLLRDNKGMFLESNLQLPSNGQLAHKLKLLADHWVDSNFNQIQLDVYENCLEFLQEHIEPISDEDLLSDIETIEARIEILNDRIYAISDLKDYEEYDSKHYKIDTLVEKIETLVSSLEDDIEELKEEIDNLQEDNYPMWNTLFELKSNWSTITDEAQKLGLGLINSNEYFSDTLFMSSCGHSFYSDYWIPLYLAVSSNWINAQYKTVNYGGQ